MPRWTNEPSGGTIRAERQRRYRRRQARGLRMFDVEVSNRTIETMIDAGRVREDATDAQIAVELAAMIEERVSLLR